MPVPRDGTWSGYDIDDTRRRVVGREFSEKQERERCLRSWLDDRTVVGRQCRCDLPRGHEQREVPRNDLVDDAKRLPEMIIEPSSARTQPAK